ncbi:acyl-protein synthetase [Sphingomonas sp.]|jgi:phenylacetate-coenzyme A ligase PaaK-like adenylate-forming protein|uniref:LuxE/PaaK family acyltransferase n=1 Tax=Sphingomonas sp. TaxID=28214 RepID=UPI002DEBC1E8|nr:acyl-protein synthetase [Sphingomonas sp.]
MMGGQELFGGPAYGLDRAAKGAALAAVLQELTEHHARNCEPYRNILQAYGPRPTGGVEDIPFIPVRLFKQLDLRSIPQESVFKTLTSSGTTGQTPSRIYLDAETAGAQSRALAKIVTDFIGPTRLPMLIIDHPSTVKDRRTFSARGAGILGMMTFGRQHAYALSDETMELDFDQLDGFAERHAGQPIVAFGFTFMVWRYFLQQLERAGRKLPFENGILFHSGGWKKLEDEAVSNERFKEAAAELAGFSRVHNFYGMVEQVGSVFMECEAGRLHTPAFADLIVRDPLNWAPLAIGQEGIIQVLSILPRSYPGHSLLTEDRGVITGEDDCPCGRLGKTFRVQGRIPMAELRGCSDTHAAQAS